MKQCIVGSKTMVRIDMDMPESCVLCRFSWYDGEYVRCPYMYNKAIEEWDDADSKRAEWCPLEDERMSGWHIWHNLRMMRNDYWVCKDKDAKFRLPFWVGVAFEKLFPNNVIKTDAGEKL